MRTASISGYIHPMFYNANVADCISYLNIYEKYYMYIHQGLHQMPP